jgi:hypothetical protein
MCYVNLHQERWPLSRMKLHHLEVVLNEPSLNKCALVSVHHLIEPQRQVIGKKLGGKLPENMDRGNRPKILDSYGLDGLWDQNHEPLVDYMEVPGVQVPEGNK